MKEKTSEKMELACIGPAGEKMVKYASIATGGKESRMAGRAGVGAVMGSKNLKAIVVYGNLTLEIKEKDKLDKYIKARSKEMVELSKPDMVNRDSAL